jgi:sulfoxide reductase catalytic subunit YedY
MVVPWKGFSVAALIKKANLLSTVKFVGFKTIFYPEQMSGQSNDFTGGEDNYLYV